MADKSEDLIKYMTVQVVQYMETSQEDRQQNRAKAKAAKEPWLTKWFGIAPFGVALWWRSRGAGDEGDHETAISGQTEVKEML